MPYSYFLFGIAFRSEIRLPELVETIGASEATLSIRRARVDPDLAGATYINRNFQMLDDEIKLTIPGIARFHLRGGSEVDVDPDPSVPERQVNLYLLGAAMGLICLQRGLVPLHANAVEVEGRAVAFCGASGAGKSTLAAHYFKNGHDVLTDDVCVLDFTGEGAAPVVQPGISRIRLWDASLHVLGEDRGQFEAIGPGIDKYSWKTPSPVEPLKLGALYILTSHASDQPMAIRRLHGGEAISGVIEQIYRQDLLRLAPDFKFRFERALALAAQVPIFAVSWPHDFAALPANAQRLHEHVVRQGLSIA